MERSAYLKKGFKLENYEFLSSLSGFFYALPQCYNLPASAVRALGLSSVKTGALMAEAGCDWH